MPHCLMCIRFNRKCPGPTDAPLLFVDTSSYPSGKKPRAKKLTREASSLDVARRFEDGRGIAVGVGELPEEMCYVLSVDVSPRYVVSEAFFANLVGYFCAEGRHVPGAVRRTPSWLHAIPRMATISPSSESSGNTSANGNEALALALRATTEAFSSLETRNQALMAHACGLYGASLRFQGKVLRLKADKSGDMYMVVTSLMLSLFEAVAATSSEGYALHIIGAAKMIDNALNRPAPAGKGGGHSPMLVNIFFHIRIQLAFVFLTTLDPRSRDDPVMTRVLRDACGWTREQLPLNMQIITPLARLLELLFSSEGGMATPHSEVIRRKISYTRAREEVNKIWADYEQQSVGQRLCWRSPGTGHTDFRDPFTSLTYAYFSACHILLNILAPTLVDSPPQRTTGMPYRQPPGRSASTSSTSSTSTRAQPENESTTPTTSPPSASKMFFPKTNPSFPHPPTIDHYALILSVAWYLRLRDTGFAYLRLHTPLFLVAMYAPSIEQRSIARMVFEDWKSGSLRGIGGLAMIRLHKTSEGMMRVAGSSTTAI